MKTLTIVIVDDQLVHRMTMERIVRAAVAGHTSTSPDQFTDPIIKKFEEAESALGFLTKFEADLVLTDLTMKDSLYNGFDLLQLLKAKPKTENVPVIVVSQNSDTKMITAALEAGAMDYWVKPVDVAQSRFRIRNVLTASRSAYARAQFVEQRQEMESVLAQHRTALMLSAQLAAVDTTVAARDAKDLFVAMVSHEFRTPLQSIVSTVETLGRRLKQLDLPEDEIETMRTPMRRLQQDASQLMEQASGLADLVRIEAGREERLVKEVELPTFLEDIVAVHDENARSKGFSVRASAREATASIDVMRLRLIASNLLGNAVKYTRAGEVSVILDLIEHKGQPMISFVVSDTGIGIPEDLLPHVFERWRRGVTGERGMGLGLAIVERLVTAMKGVIEIQSRVGAGTTVSVLLPLYPAAEDVAKTENAPTYGAGPRPKTLDHLEQVRLAGLDPVVTGGAGPAMAVVTELVRSITDSVIRSSSDLTDIQLVANAPGPSKQMVSTLTLPFRTLVVDDSSNPRTSLVEALNDAGADVGEASNGYQALEAIEAYSWDVVFLDIQMPGLDGYKVASAVRKMTLAKRPLIVAMSAFELDEVAARGGDPNGSSLFDEFVRKPVELSQLIYQINARLQTAGNAFDLPHNCQASSSH